MSKTDSNDYGQDDFDDLAVDIEPATSEPPAAPEPKVEDELAARRPITEPAPKRPGTDKGGDVVPFQLDPETERCEAAEPDHEASESVAEPDEDPDDPEADDAKSEPHPVLGLVLTRNQLAALPKPQPLITDVLDLRTTALLVGDTGTNKTFVGLGWACSVATGTPWLGHEVAVDPAPVMYVVGEGGYGLDRRIAAWEKHNGVPVPNEMFVSSIRPESLTSEKFWPEVTALAEDIGARFVVLDTFSSLAPDADETTDVAQLIRDMTDLSAVIDGSVVLVHHSGWTERQRARGGSQLHANCDAVIVASHTSPKSPASSPVEIQRLKVKEGEAGTTLRIKRTVVPLGADEDGKPIDSCVVEIDDKPESDGDSKIIGVMCDVACVMQKVGSVDSFTALCTQMTEHGKGRNRGTTGDAVQRLIDLKCLREEWIGNARHLVFLRSYPVVETDEAEVAR